MKTTAQETRRHHIQQWYSIPAFLDQHECDRAQALCDELEVEPGALLTDEGRFINHRMRLCSSAWMLRDDQNQWLFERIMAVAEALNSRTYRFHIDSLEPLHYLDYGLLGHYGRHVDNGADDVATRKLTLLIQLSDYRDYIGGNTLLDAPDRHGRLVAPKNRGDLVIFPSHMPHRATRVLMGRRRALVGWVRGSEPLR